MKSRLIFLVFVFFFILPIKVNAEDIGFVIGDYVTIRSKASSSSSKITRLIYGTKVDILETSNDFYKINYDGINTAYIKKDFVKRKEEYTLKDDQYCKTLTNAGFHSSYCPYLSYLHKIHPTWTFTPLVTNLDFYKDVVNGEEGKNYIQYITSDGTNFLNAYASSDKVKEVGGWYQATNTVNAYVLDPRNFLLEKSVFMFENLNYNKTYQNTKTISSIFTSSSFLSKDPYLKYYIEAGESYNVSPNHLAARTRQEGASKETYTPVTGTCTSTYDGNSLKGYYNFYNIGAYADSKTSSPVVRGLAYAANLVNKGTNYGRPWNTREKAIKGGANFIANGYTSKGQNTLYFEKFQTNPNSPNSLYTHQYMTNIFAAYSEGLMMKEAYTSANLLDTAFNFIIPVYKNMPDSTSQATLLSGNNLLSSININGKKLTNFDPDITNYTEYVIDTTNEVSITALTNSSDATVEGTGVYPLIDEKNTFEIIVTAQNGVKKTYKIEINVVKDMTLPEDIIDKISVKVNDKNLYDIKSGVGVSTMLKSISKISPSVTVMIKDTSGNILSDGTIKTGDKLILKTLISEQVEYTLSVNGDINGDGKITIQDLLKIQKHILGTKTLKGAYKYAADTNGDSKINNIDLLRVQKHILGSINL